MDFSSHPSKNTYFEGSGARLEASSFNAKVGNSKNEVAGMGHEADAAGLPKVDTGEACAFSVDGDGAVIRGEAVGGIVVHARDAAGRVRAEETQAAEERHRAIVEQVPAVNYTLAPAPEGEPGTMANGSLSYISPRIEHLLGHPPEAFTSDPKFWRSLVHPEDLDMVLAEDILTDESGGPFGMEYRMRHKGGHYLWVKDDAVLIRSEGGSPLLWQCVLSDITRRREAEEEVRRLNEGLGKIVADRTSQLMGALEEAEDSEELMRLSESRFRSLVQRSSDITAVIDDDGAIIYVSPAVEATLGYRIGELMEDKVPHHVHRDDGAKLREAFEKVRARAGETENVEFRFRHKDGSWRSLDAVLSNLSDEPGVAGIVVNARDVTERREAEEDLRKSLNVLLALYETGQILTSTLDLDTRGKRLLEIMAGLFGLRAAAIELADPNGLNDVLRPWKSKGDEAERLRSRQTAACVEARRDALASGEPRAFRQSEDTSLPPEGVCVPLRSQGRIVGFVEAFGGEGLGGKENLDVFASLGNQSGSALENARLYSDLAERERRLEELVGKLITAQEEERRRVAYEIHDGLAQTALAASQMLQTFLEGHPPGSPVEEGSLDRAMEMVRLTGREARRVIAGLRPTVLDDFGLAQALRLHVETLRRDGLTVEYRESLGGRRLPPHVETALYRVAQEALNNALKHAPGSTARLTLYFSEEGSVRMEVADDGAGFDPASIRNGGGAGERVGISSMRESVALLGGTFEIKSRPGTTVKVEVHSRGDSGGGDGG